MARKVTVDPEEVRKDLLAALAAGRELGPEMDSALVESHLQRYYPDAGRGGSQARLPATAERPRALFGEYLRAGALASGILLPVAAILAFALLAGPALHAGWFFLPFLFWAFCARAMWGRGRRWHRRDGRYADRRFPDRRDWDDRQSQDDYHRHDGYVSRIVRPEETDHGYIQV